MTTIGRRRRGGFSLLEMAIVIAIIGIMAALAGTLLSDTLPSWRTRRAAREFSSALNKCRQLAIAEGVQYRIRMTAYDNDLDGTSDNQGAYLVERGNLANGSTSWDILPWDSARTGSNSGEGTVVISAGGEDELRGVSIANWGTLSGVDGDDIVFTPRGWLQNPVSDFSGDGYITITFVNKPGRARGNTDQWDVQVTRGGLVRMVANSRSVGASSGTPDASLWTTTSSTGYSP